MAGANLILALVLSLVSELGLIRTASRQMTELEFWTEVMGETSARLWLEAQSNGGRK